MYASDSPLPEGFSVDTDGLTAARSQLQRIGQRFSYYGARIAAVAFMAMHRFRRAGTVWRAFGKDVIVYVIAPMLYQTRQETVWRNADKVGWGDTVSK